MDSLRSVHLVFIPRVIWPLSAGHPTTVLVACQLNSLRGKDCKKETRREDLARKSALHFVAITKSKGLHSNTQIHWTFSFSYLYSLMESFSQNLNINLQMEVDRSIAQILFFLEKHMYTHTVK